MSPEPRTQGRASARQETNRESENLGNLADEAREGTSSATVDRNRPATKEDANTLRSLYLDGLAITQRIASAERKFFSDLALGPDADDTELDAEYANLKEIRGSLEDLPLAVRVAGATVTDVIGALFGTKTRGECRRICREAFGR